MTTFVRSRRNDNVLIGFAVVVLVAVTARTAAAGGTATAVIAGVLAIGVVAFGVWLNNRPSHEIRVSPSEIVYVASGNVTGRIGHGEAGGRVMVLKRIHRGRGSFSLVDAEQATTGMPLDDFRIPAGRLEAACTEHGWWLVS